MLPQQVLRIREIGDVEHPYWTAGLLDTGTLALEHGERALWSGRSRVKERRPRSWVLDNCSVVVTDRRLVFSTTSFEKSGGWVGFGVVGLAVATTANAVSKHQAAKRQLGKVAIGQVRHEWISRIWVRRVKALLGALDTYIELELPTSAGPCLVELYGPTMRDELALWIAQVVATQRLSLGLTRSDDDEAVLRRYAAGGADTSPATPGAAGWRFPGDPEALMLAGYEQLVPAEPDAVT